MKPNELRIGSYFHPCSTKGGITIPNTEIIWRVGMIDKFGKVSVIEPENHDNINLLISECSPIPITDEILKKMGFQITKGDWNVATHNVNTEFILNDKTDGQWRFTPIWCKDYQPIKYVHELQNLYFCLYGSELSLA
jgi:hypothetical protein